MFAAINGISVRAFTIPTNGPEADGTLGWDSTTIVIAFVEAGNQSGMGYTYASRASVVIIEDILWPALRKENALDIPACWQKMLAAARNLGVTGQVSAAIAAVDTALWDLKAKLLKVPLALMMGQSRTSVPVYGSGGFTTYDEKTIKSQIEDWRHQGITMFKIKIGSDPDDDAARVKAAREAAGKDNQVFVDANGAYSVKQALAFAEDFSEYNVSWFEEPVTSDNLQGLCEIKDSAPAGMDITAGEYAFDLFYVRHMLEAKAVDVLQIDATRCQGYTGFMHATSLALAHNMPVSSHCAPALHLPVCCHAPHVRHMEYFHDHVRIENMLFDGLPLLKDGYLHPNTERPGAGLILKAQDAQRFAA